MPVIKEYEKKSNKLRAYVADAAGTVSTSQGDMSCSVGDYVIVDENDNPQTVLSQADFESKYSEITLV